MVEAQLARPLPEAYRDYLARQDGWEGFIGDAYLVLWRASELATFNEDYEVSTYAPGLFLFGSNGGGSGFAFDLREPAMPILLVPLIGMSLASATPVAPSFAAFLSDLG